MTAKILDGREKAKELEESIRLRIKAHLDQGKRPPCLAVILIGEDPASTLYVKNKQRACTKVGIQVEAYLLDNTTSEENLIEIIEKLNANPNIDGILVQLPLPTSINSGSILQKMSPKKDVDGFHPYNIGLLAQQKPFLRPCTPAGIMLLLENNGIKLIGLEATVIGISNIVGKPMVLELLRAGCTVTACHRVTQNLQSHVERADLLVVAAGHPHLIPGSWIKPGAIVIDVGMNRLNNGQFVGDVDFETAKESAAWITPVPGGVGPMTVAMLLQNTVLAYETFFGTNSQCK